MAALAAIPLELRAVEEYDADVLHSWFQNEELRRLFGYRYPTSRRSWAEWAAQHGVPSYSRATFMVCYAGGGKPLGVGTLRDSGPEDRSAEISVALGVPRARRMGLGKEATVLLCRFGFYVMGLRRIYAWVLANNPSGIALCEALGGIREGVARRARLVNGEAVDVVLYGMLAEEFAPYADQSDRPSAPHGADGGMGGLP